MDEEVGRRENEIKNKDIMLQKQMASNDELKRENRQLAQKLKSLQNGLLKEL